jgi:RNA polymerase sigma-70 factor, ECF subfamily
MPHVTSYEKPAFLAFVAKCRLIWPSLELDLARFGAWLEGDSRTAPVALASEHAGDLYVAFGCAMNSAVAQRIFEENFVVHVPRYIGRLGGSPTFVDDVKQALRERLLLAAPGLEPRVAAYRARGPLGAWVRAAAIRIALNLQHANGNADGYASDAALEGVHGETDPEMDYVRATYAQSFRTAFEMAIASQSEDDRAVLRLYYLEGNNVEQVGLHVQVHRATVARRLHRIRGEVLTQTCEELRQRHSIDETELGALLELAADPAANVSCARILLGNHKK